MKRTIIDCDPARDDAIVLVLAHRYVQLAHITTYKPANRAVVRRQVRGVPGTVPGASCLPSSPLALS